MMIKRMRKMKNIGKMKIIVEIYEGVRNGNMKIRTIARKIAESVIARSEFTLIFLSSLFSLSNTCNTF